MATILAVDDRDLNRNLLTTLLGYGGHRLLEASNGPEGLTKVQAENPELIITDILMPDMDGYEFVRKVRTLPIAHQPKIIFYSATYLENEALALARACGVNRVICKPAEPEQVLKAVDEALAFVEGKNAPSADSRTQDGEAVKVLSNKLYQKVKELEELNSELERRIAERTSDLEQTNGDGFTVMQRLKANYDLMLVPIIVVSARDPLVNQQRALEAGAELFFQKPIDNDEFFCAVQKALLKGGSVEQEVPRK